MIVKPAPDLVVRHPVTKQQLPPEGIEVPDGDIFWTRVLNDGDVVKVSEKDFAAAQAQAQREAQAKADADAAAAASNQPAATATAATDEGVEK